METLLFGIVHDGGDFVAALEGPPREGEAAARGEPLRGTLPHVTEGLRARIGGRTALGVAALTAGAVVDEETGLQVSTCRDWEAELAGALGGRVGVLVHSGMRASAMAVNASGQAIRVQQTDEVLGEEGSALWLCTRALRMAVQGEAGRMQRSDRLRRTLLACFATDSLDELVVRFESGHIRREEMAGFISPLLHLGAYPDPEPACRALLLQASRRLATLARTAVEKAQIVSPAAGCWSGPAMHPPLTEIFADDVSHVLDGLSWDEARGDALEGALALAAAVRRVGEAAGAVGPRVWQAALEM